MPLKIQVSTVLYSCLVSPLLSKVSHCHIRVSSHPSSRKSPHCHSQVSSHPSSQKSHIVVLKSPHKSLTLPYSSLVSPLLSKVSHGSAQVSFHPSSRCYSHCRTRVSSHPSSQNSHIAVLKSPLESLTLPYSSLVSPLLSKVSHGRAQVSFHSSSRKSHIAVLECRLIHPLKSLISLY